MRSGAEAGTSEWCSGIEMDRDDGVEVEIHAGVAPLARRGKNRPWSVFPLGRPLRRGTVLTR